MYNVVMAEQKYRKKNRIGKRLKKLLGTRGISVNTLSKEIGVSRSALFDYLNEVKNPTDKTLNMIADYFSVPVEYLTNSFSYYDENVFIYITNLRNGLIATNNSNKSTNHKEYQLLMRQYIDYFEKLPNYYKFDYLNNFFTIVFKGIFSYMSGNEFAFEAEIIPYNRHHIQKRLIAAVKASGLSVTKIAQQSGVERGRFENYLSGRLNPSDQTLQKITKGLGLPEDFFTASSPNGAIQLGDSILFSPIHQKEHIPYKYNPSEDTVKKAHKNFYDYWNSINKIADKMSDDSIAKVNDFLKCSFNQLKDFSDSEIRKANLKAD